MHQITATVFAMPIWALQIYVIILCMIKYITEIFTLFNGPVFSRIAGYVMCRIYSVFYSTTRTRDVSYI